MTNPRSNPAPRSVGHAPGRPNTVLVTALLGACAIAYVFFLFIPGQREIAHLRQQRHQKQQQILQAASLAMQLSQAKQMLTLTSAVSQEWQAASPTPTELVATYAKLTEEAQASGLTLRRFDPQLAVDGKLIGEHNLTLAWQGSFPQAFDFIRRLEQLPPTIWVRQFNFAASTDDRETLQGELTLTIFVDRTGNSD